MSYGRKLQIVSFRLGCALRSEDADEFLTIYDEALKTFTSREIRFAKECALLVAELNEDEFETALERYYTAKQLEDSHQSGDESENATAVACGHDCGNQLDTGLCDAEQLVAAMRSADKDSFASNTNRLTLSTRYASSHSTNTQKASFTTYDPNDSSDLDRTPDDDDDDRYDVYPEDRRERYRSQDKYENDRKSNTERYDAEFECCSTSNGETDSDGDALTGQVNSYRNGVSSYGSSFVEPFASTVRHPSLAPRDFAIQIEPDSESRMDSKVHSAYLNKYQDPYASTRTPQKVGFEAQREYNSKLHQIGCSQDSVGNEYEMHTFTSGSKTEFYQKYGTYARDTGIWNKQSNYAGIFRRSSPDEEDENEALPLRHDSTFTGDPSTTSAKSRGPVWREEARRDAQAQSSIPVQIPAAASVSTSTPLITMPTRNDDAAQRLAEAPAPPQHIPSSNSRLAQLKKRKNRRKELKSNEYKTDDDLKTWEKNLRELGMDDAAIAELTATKSSRKDETNKDDAEPKRRAKKQMAAEARRRKDAEAQKRRQLARAAQSRSTASTSASASAKCSNDETENSMHNSNVDETDDDDDDNDEDRERASSASRSGIDSAGDHSRCRSVSTSKSKSSSADAEYRVCDTNSRPSQSKPPLSAATKQATLHATTATPSASQLASSANATRNNTTGTLIGVTKANGVNGIPTSEQSFNTTVMASANARTVCMLSSASVCSSIRDLARTAPPSNGRPSQFVPTSTLPTSRGSNVNTNGKRNDTPPPIVQQPQSTTQQVNQTQQRAQVITQQQPSAKQVTQQSATQPNESLATGTSWANVVRYTTASKPIAQSQNGSETGTESKSTVTRSDDEVNSQAIPVAISQDVQVELSCKTVQSVSVSDDNSQLGEASPSEMPHDRNNPSDKHSTSSRDERAQLDDACLVQVSQLIQNSSLDTSCQTQTPHSVPGRDEHPQTNETRSPEASESTHNTLLCADDVTTPSPIPTSCTELKEPDLDNQGGTQPDGLDSESHNDADTKADVVLESHGVEHAQVADNTEGQITESATPILSHSVTANNQEILVVDVAADPNCVLVPPMAPTHAQPLAIGIMPPSMAMPISTASPNFGPCPMPLQLAPAVPPVPFQLTGAGMQTMPFAMPVAGLPTATANSILWAPGPAVRVAFHVHSPVVVNGQSFTVCHTLFVNAADQLCAYIFGEVPLSEPINPSANLVYPAGIASQPPTAFSPYPFVPPFAVAHPPVPSAMTMPSLDPSSAYQHAVYQSQAAQPMSGRNEFFDTNVIADANNAQVLAPIDQLSSPTVDCASQSPADTDSPGADPSRPNDSLVHPDLDTNATTKSLEHQLQPLESDAQTNYVRFDAATEPLSVLHDTPPIDVDDRGAQPLPTFNGPSLPSELLQSGTDADVQSGDDCDPSLQSNTVVTEQSATEPNPDVITNEVSTPDVLPDMTTASNKPKSVPSSGGFTFGFGVVDTDAASNGSTSPSGSSKWLLGVNEKSALLAYFDRAFSAWRNAPNLRIVEWHPGLCLRRQASCTSDPVDDSAISPTSTPTCADVELTDADRCCAEDGATQQQQEVSVEESNSVSAEVVEDAAPQPNGNASDAQSRQTASLNTERIKQQQQRRYGHGYAYGYGQPVRQYAPRPYYPNRAAPNNYVHGGEWRPSRGVRR